MKLTIEQIAKMAGVSRGTVSKVINNTGSISPKTIKKVKRVIEETGYQPSFSAKTLATQKSNLIGLIFAGNINARINHPFFTEVINAFKTTIGKLGYDLLIFSNNNFSKNEQDYLARSKHFHLDGCLIIAGEKVEQAVPELDQSSMPCVGIDIKLTGPNSVYIMSDNIKAATLVVEYFHENAINNVAFIAGPEDSIISNIRKDAFIESMNRFGMPVRKEWIQHGDYFEKSGYEAMKRILAEHPIPDAVYAVSDMMAIGAMKAIKDEGLSIPDDIVLIGTDDIEVCKFTDPPLATVMQNKEKMGTVAAHMLFELINGKETSDQVLVDPELLIRESGLIQNNHMKR
ncbi:LacI family DNA-binding transcriptional regulator [Oceanobacillus bengalensis]|uniref:LacI family transcriptional regulator n=1 Tax=Oceanobacillus bengalensis TaxID=1435466 RepID=A0A494Z919_9BACI|nr:LacI family DNA-binding transcriptional regulator [Oceanobacillus bengalensis]RKQ18559.1 LacI family transcriptional regulator [Oceanobacillus bengalensis]